MSRNKKLDSFKKGTCVGKKMRKRVIRKTWNAKITFYEFCKERVKRVTGIIR